MCNREIIKFSLFHSEAGLCKYILESYYAKIKQRQFHWITDYIVDISVTSFPPQSKLINWYKESSITPCQGSPQKNIGVKEGKRKRIAHLPQQAEGTWC